MTVLCIAMGTPLPTVTLYINGHPLRNEITRHMVTMVHNVTSDMGHVSCIHVFAYHVSYTSHLDCAISHT